MYKKDSKGKIRVWCVGIQEKDDGVYLVIGSGLDGGKKTTTYKEVEGKNIGRANETTPWEQARKELRALEEKKYKQGYRHTIEELDEVPMRPMLATKWEDRKKDITYPALIQPKLDGVRCWATKTDGEIVYTSRTGEVYHTLTHLDDIFKELLEEGATLDGEVYVHGWSLQRIVSAVKKENEDTPNLQWYVYDAVMPDATCETRLALLQNVFNDPKWLLSPVRFTYTNLVDGEEDVMSFTHAAMEEGFEGAIVRNCDGMYKHSHRSKDLQKVKMMQDAEFPIIGYNKEKIYDLNGTARNAVMWVVQVAEGITCDVRPKGSHEERIAWYATADQQIGKMLTVQFQAYTDEGNLQFPVGIVVRDYE